MTKLLIDRAVVEQALEALDPHKSTVLRWVTPVDKAITALRSALESGESVGQEPVGRCTIWDEYRSASLEDTLRLYENNKTYREALEMVRDALKKYTNVMFETNYAGEALVKIEEVLK